MHDDLEAIVARVGHLARRLVVLDLDGTLAPITDDPDAGALPRRGARGDQAARGWRQRDRDHLRTPHRGPRRPGRRAPDPALHPGRAPLVFGDSLTDEEAFVAARDLAVHGVLVHDRPRPTAARWRLDDPERVVRALVDLDPAGSARRGASDRVREHPIEEYGLITDSRTAALVSPDASIDWLCLPRFDSPTAFAALLDPVRGGRFRVRPHDTFDIQGTYLGESNVLVTRFVADGDPGLTVTDFLVHSRVNAFDPTHTGHLLIRRVETFREVVAEVEFQPDSTTAARERTSG